jgi:death-on-curing protein
MTTLTKEQIKRLHRQMIAATGGADGLRDENALDSALNAAFHGFGGTEFYQTVVSKIARLTYGIIANHPFTDGNKRVGTYVMLVLLELNRIDAEFTDNDIIRIGLEIAGGKMSVLQLLSLILERTT